MSEGYGDVTAEGQPFAARYSGRVALWGTILVTINVGAMLGLASSEYAEFGVELFSNLWTGVGAVAAVIGAGFLIATFGTMGDKVTYSLVGLILAQGGFALVGGTVLSYATPDERVLAAGGAVLATTVLAGVVGSVVLGSSRSFARWSQYSFGLVTGGLAVWFVGGLVHEPLAWVGIGIIPLGFFALFVHKLWRVREKLYSNSFQAAVGVYFAVMVFAIYLLYWIASLLWELEV